MDTRSKIVSEEDARKLAGAREIVWARGHFDPLLAEHARSLLALTGPGKALVVVILNPSAPLFSSSARAELVAALDCVDYVVAGPAAASPHPEHERITREFTAQVLARYSGRNLA